ncbi:MAG: GNAT family N-acetyltransferase, partial [Clostridium sp.]
MKIIIKSFEELSTRELYEILKVRNEVFFLEQRCMLQDCDDGDFKSYHLMYEEDGILGAYLR